VEEVKDEKTATTFTALQSKLETLLIDGVGGTPKVTISPHTNNISSDLVVELELAWDFTDTKTLLIVLSDLFSESDYKKYKSLDYFANALLPGEGEASISVNGELAFRLGVGLEYVSQTGNVKPYVCGTTGFFLKLDANGEASYDASVGAFQGSIDANVSVEVGLDVGLNSSLNYYLLDEEGWSRDGFESVSSISALVNKVTAEFSGTASGTVVAGLSLLGTSVNVDVRISDLSEFFRNASALIIDIDVTTPPAKIPSFLDILLAEPQGIIDALDDVFRTAEEACLGPNGIVTRFPIPFIRNGLGNALGAGTQDSVLARGRRKIIPKLQEALNSFEGDTTTVGDVLARLMEKAMDLINIRCAASKVTFACYQYNVTVKGIQEIVPCKHSKPGPTSAMWSLPFGQELTVELPLDFHLDAGAFPLELTLAGDDIPTLSIGWEFSLAFGFDKTSGFFLYTDFDREISVKCVLSVLNYSVDATLLFLKASIDNLNLEVAAGLFVDMDKAKALRLPRGENKTDPDFGRLSRASFRRIVKLSDLFEVSAITGATIEAPSVVFEFNGDIFGKGEKVDTITKFIPKLQAEIYAHARKKLSASSNRRKLEIDFRETTSQSGTEDPSSPCLSKIHSDILSDNFTFPSCPIDLTHENFCARVNNLMLNMTSLKELVGPILSDITNSDETGFLDKLVQPLIVLDNPLPGISDIMDKDISVLDVAEVSGVQAMLIVYS